MLATMKRSAYALPGAATPVTGKRTGRSTWSLAGPAVVASVAYMDPGNFATNIQAGSTYGYALLWVVLVSSIVAMLFQAMSAKLGIVTGRSLAEVCRAEFSPRLVLGMWVGAEVAAIATDLAEFMGGAIGIALLFHIAIFWGLVITGLVTFGILAFGQRGCRPLEILIGALVAVISLSYLAELFIAPPNWHAVIFHTFVPQLHGSDALMLAVGIVGATIMPHAIYLHSGLTQHRVPTNNDAQRRTLLRFSNREVIVALGVAALVNMAMVAMSASVFQKAAPGIADIAAAYHTLAPALGEGAAALFLVALLASGISSSVVGTMAGQNIMQGFLGFNIPVLARRLITMIPAIIICMASNPMKAMVDSQIVLSIMLPLPLIALVVLSSRRHIMGAFVASRRMTVLASIATAAIIALNVALLCQSVGA